MFFQMIFEAKVAPKRCITVTIVFDLNDFVTFGANVKMSHKATKTIEHHFENFVHSCGEGCSIPWQYLVPTQSATRQKIVQVNCILDFEITRVFCNCYLSINYHKTSK